MIVYLLQTQIGVVLLFILLITSTVLFISVLFLKLVLESGYFGGDGGFESGVVVERIDSIS